MAVTRSLRAALYASLVDATGDDGADTLMDQRPPTGSDQMATKDDRAGAESRLQAAPGQPLPPLRHHRVRASQPRP